MNELFGYGNFCVLKESPWSNDLITHYDDLKNEIDNRYVVIKTSLAIIKYNPILCHKIHPIR